MAAALEASGAEIVTVALRRADLSGKKDPYADILDFIDPAKYLLLPQHQRRDERRRGGAPREARRRRRAAKVGQGGDPSRPPLPSARPVETLEATIQLVKEGFVVLPYINADPVLAKRLQEAGAATVMPLGSPIGSHRGLETRAQIEIIVEQATVPVIVDAGIGAPSHAAAALELGADAVLVNTAMAVARDPAAMAHAFRLAVEAGRLAYETGLGTATKHAEATSPLTGFLNAA